MKIITQVPYQNNFRFLPTGKVLKQKSKQMSPDKRLDSEDVFMYIGSMNPQEEIDGGMMT